MENEAMVANQDQIWLHAFERKTFDPMDPKSWVFFLNVFK